MKICWIRYRGGNSVRYSTEVVIQLPLKRSTRFQRLFPNPSWLVEEGHPNTKNFALTFQYEAHEKDYYTSSDAARVNKVRASVYGKEERPVDVMAFVDFEKAFDRVPRKVVWWALRYLGVNEWIVSVIKQCMRMQRRK